MEHVVYLHACGKLQAEGRLSNLGCDLEWSELLVVQLVGWASCGDILPEQPDFIFGVEAWGFSAALVSPKGMLSLCFEDVCSG